jgi:hypothetical protein
VTQKNDVTTDSIEAQIRQDLQDRHGPLLSGEALRIALGYPSLAALRQGIARATVPVATFLIPRRRGRFALTWDVASWLAQQRKNDNASLENSQLQEEAMPDT